MNIKDNLLNFLYDKKYFVSLYENKIYIYGFKKIDILTGSEVVIYIEDSKYIISGNNLSTIKLLDNEICLTGSIKNIRIDNE